MSTIICQNLVSCFESQLTETTATLKLKVAPPPPPAAIDFCKKLATEDHKNHEFGNWGFLQTVPEKSGDYKESYYTQSFAKKSSFSRLSLKSLELCTENLGSETGTDIISDSSSIFSSSSSPPYSPSSNSGEDFVSRKRDGVDEWIQKPKSPHHKESSSGRKITNFPPPLTTMSGSSSLQVRRHREDGRLIIEAVEAPFRNSYLQAERSDGRLKLCFLTNSDAEEIAPSAEEEEEECGEETTGDEEIIEEPGYEIDSEMEEFDGDVNLEMGMETFQRLSRCKEGSHGNKGLCSNWKHALWVATS